MLVLANLFTSKLCDLGLFLSYFLLNLEIDKSGVILSQSYFLAFSFNLVGLCECILCNNIVGLCESIS